MNFLHGFSLNAACTLLAFSLGFVNSVILAGGLGRESYGLLKLWMAAVMLGALLLGEWLNKGNTYVVGKQRERGTAVTGTLLYGLLVGTLLLVAAHAAPAFAHGPLAGVPAAEWYLAAGLVTATLLQKAGLSILLGEDRLTLYAVLPVVFICAYLAGNLVLEHLGILDLASVMGVWLFAAGATAAAVLAPSLSAGYRPAASHLRGLRALAALGVRGELALVLVFLLLKSDVFLISHFLGQEPVGVYGVATNFTDMMQRVPNIASVVLFAKVVRDQDSAQLPLRVARWVLVFSLLAAAGLVLLGRAFLNLFFPLYPDAYVPLVWLLPGMLFSGVGAIFNAKLLGQGYPPVTMWAPGVALALNVSLNLLLIPRLGLRGAALSTSVAYALWGILVARAYFRQAGLRWSSLLRPPAAAPTLDPAPSHQTTPGNDVL